MPIIYENTDRLVRKGKLSPSPTITSFLAGVVVGFFVLPIILPIIGYQVTKRWGPPE